MFKEVGSKEVYSMLESAAKCELSTAAQAYIVCRSHTLLQKGCGYARLASQLIRYKGQTSHTNAREERIVVVHLHCFMVHISATAITGVHELL